MRVIVAGSRTIMDYERVKAAIQDSGFEVTEIVSGTAPGVDTLGEVYAKEHRLPVRMFPGNWKKYGKAAGYLRNLEMAKYADAVIAVWDGKSHGTKNMISIAQHRGMPVKIYTDDSMFQAKLFVS